MATEEIRLGDVDAIDEFCVISIFDEAAHYLSGNSRLKLTTDQKLAFYALFKQATVGPCDKPKPGMLEMVEKAKWSAWKKLGKMGKEEAIAQYVKLLDRIAPQWKQELGDMDAEDKAEETGGGGGGGGGLDLSPAVSRPVYDDSDASTQPHDLCYFASIGDTQALTKLLDSGVPLSYTNQEHQSAVMLAVDRGQEAALDVLLARARTAGGDTLTALLALQDSDGMTALHYACVCDMEGCAVRLVDAGADPDATNGEGESCWDCANEKLQSAIKRARDKQKRP